MAKSVGRACAQIAILLTIFGSILCVKSISPNTYNTADSYLSYIQPGDVVLLSGEAEHHRERRAVPADSTPVVGAAMQQDVKNQYTNANSTSTNASNRSGLPEATVTTVANKMASGVITGSVAYNIHNVGVNGTGQRKDMSDGKSNTTADAVVNPPKKPQLMSTPKKVAASSSNAPAGVAAAGTAAAAAVGGAVTIKTTTTEASLIDEVDVSEEVITKEALNHSLTNREDHFDYYSSRLYVNKAEADALWEQMKSIPKNDMLSSSHRRATTVELTFDFPFYGRDVRNITVATGGFMYTGEYVHSWLAATQYIAPLMANFDTSISNYSYVRLQDNGTAFTVVWVNATLQDRRDYGQFTFSATLHKNGDIKFVYYVLPTLINTIEDTKHPVKVGLSDAYILDNQHIFTRRKTIYEYHRVTFEQPGITNSSIVVLTALPTCLDYTDCQACVQHNTTFSCAWCPALNRCSTSNGNDRRKQEWMEKDCERSALTDVHKCPAIGQKGNNAATATISSAQDNSNSKTGSNASVNGAGSNSSSSSSSSSTPTPNSASVTEPTVSSTQQQSTQTGAAMAGGAGAAGDAHKGEKSEHLDAALTAENKNVGVAFGFMIPICLVFAVTLWLFYAYRNPHTRSGQLLIQFRPSQWSWRRGEARYTAATIHM